MKVLITGDTSYSNRIKIRKILLKLNKSHNIIATFGKIYGVDKIVQQQQQQLQKNTYYFKLYSQLYTVNCLQQKYKFTIGFNPMWYTYRNLDASNWADIIIIFYRKQLDKQMQQLYKQAVKLEKQIFLINDN